jgi:hypothetical protein
MSLAATAPIVVRRPCPVRAGRIPPPAVDKTTVGRHLHRPVTVETRHAADVMIAGPHRHLPLTEATTDATTVKWLRP